MGSASTQIALLALLSAVPEVSSDPSFKKDKLNGKKEMQSKEKRRNMRDSLPSASDVLDLSRVLDGHNHRASRVKEPGDQ